jgi:zinc/manganese transport system substrate-binding protein
MTFLNNIFVKMSLGSLFIILLTACQSAPLAHVQPKKTILVTYSILGALVKDLVQDKAAVVVLIPNGQDPHEWEPSAKDMEQMARADLIVQNGLGLESGLEKSLGQAKEMGRIMFTASDFIDVRKVGPGEGIPSGDADQTIGASDPHLWMDPMEMRKIAVALAKQLNTDLKLDISVPAATVDQRLIALDQEIAASVETIPPINRQLVTGHESLGYFARRYKFHLVGAIIPSLSAQAEVSASDLAALKILIQTNHVKAVFTELGTPRSISDVIGQETGVKVVQVSTHLLSADGSYFTFMRAIAGDIVQNLKN